MSYGYVSLTVTSSPGVVQFCVAHGYVAGGAHDWISISGSVRLRLLAAFLAAVRAEAPLSPTKRLVAALRAATRDASVNVS